MPRMMTSTEVELAMAGPAVMPTVPAACWLVSCKPMIMSGLPKYRAVVGEHGLGAVDGLFRGLADEHSWCCAIGTLPRPGATGRCLQDGGNVVPAGFHDADFLAGLAQS